MSGPSDLATEVKEALAFTHFVRTHPRASAWEKKTADFFDAFLKDMDGREVFRGFSRLLRHNKVTPVDFFVALWRAWPGEIMNTNERDPAFILGTPEFAAAMKAPRLPDYERFDLPHIITVAGIQFNALDYPFITADSQNNVSLTFISEYGNKYYVVEMLIYFIDYMRRFTKHIAG